MKQLKILKIGGKVLESEPQLNDLLDAFVRWDGWKILVHGGGKAATHLATQLGIEAQMIDGRRITDEAMLEIVTMVYAGQINKKIVSELQKRNCNALGLSGADGNLIKAHKRVVRAIDYGYAGDIDAVDTERLIQLLELGFTPVFCALTHDGNGQILNTNADTISAALGVALAPYYQTEILYCFDKAGVLTNPKEENSVIPELHPGNFESYKQQGIISDGMIAKLENAFAAIDQQVDRVRLGSVYSLLNNCDTKIVKNS